MHQLAEGWKQIHGGAGRRKQGRGHGRVGDVQGVLLSIPQGDRKITNGPSQPGSRLGEACALLRLGLKADHLRTPFLGPAHPGLRLTGEGHRSCIQATQGAIQLQKIKPGADGVPHLFRPAALQQGQSAPHGRGRHAQRLEPLQPRQSGGACEKTRETAVALLRLQGCRFEPGIGSLPWGDGLIGRMGRKERLLQLGLPPLLKAFLEAGQSLNSPLALTQLDRHPGQGGPATGGAPGPGQAPQQLVAPL